MSLHRVRTRLRKELAEHKEGERDGHEPTAEAHRVFAGHLAEDLAAVEAAIAGEHAIEKLLRDELDAARAERDALRDAIDRETITIGPALPVLRRAIGLATGGSVEPLPPRLPVDYDAGGE